MDYWKGEVNGFTFMIEPHVCGRYYVAVEDLEGRVMIDPSLSAEMVCRMIVAHTFPGLAAMMYEAKKKAKEHGKKEH